MRAILAIAWLLVCVSCAQTQRRATDQERARLHMKVGVGHLAQGHYPQAMSELLRAETLDPLNPEIQNHLGLAYYVRGRLKEAEGKLREALRLDANFSDAKNNLARVLIDQNRDDEALKWLHQVESDLTYPYPEKTFSHLGMVYFERGEYKKAEKYLLRSLEIRRQDCTSTHYYGRSLMELKKWEVSARTLDQAIEFCRSLRYEEPLFYSAMSYFTLGEKEKSRARLEELLKEYPQSQFVAKAKAMLELLEQ